MQTKGTAALLSALLPGLGQFYNRDWLKGVLFLAAMVIADAALDVTADTIQLFHAIVGGVGQTAEAATMPSLGSLLIRSVPVFVVVCWSVADAARGARQRLTSAR
ncbi:MAG TPA: DUF5683 domain-containing protein [Nitrospirales bacterium]|nr:DUF5683 domain-containing protein [Nitrospirales bacterium]